MINRDILGYAKKEIEKGRKVRTDCTSLVQHSPAMGFDPVGRLCTGIDAAYCAQPG